MKPLSTAILLCISIYASAQTNFTPGYIVKSSGDTLRGYLQEELRKDILFSIKFKVNNTSTSFETFTSTNIMGFKYESGDLYKSISFKNTLNDTAAVQTSFALQLVTGPYNLYSYIENEETYFVVLGNNVSYFIYNTVTDNSGLVKIEGNYSSRLQALAVSCHDRSLHSDLITYNEKDISDFIYKLNNCIAPNSSSTNHYQKQKALMSVSLFAGGISVGKNRNQLTGDLALRIIYPQLSKNVSLNIGVHYSHTTDDKRQKLFGSNVELSITKDDIFCVPLTMQYNIGQGIIQPFFYGGFGAAYVKEQSTYSVYAQNPLPNLPAKFEASVIGAIGIEGHVTSNLYIRAEWRYEEIFQYPAIGLSYNFK
jgi:hypothetical protein